MIIIPQFLKARSPILHFISVIIYLQVDEDSFFEAIQQLNHKWEEAKPSNVLLTFSEIISILFVVADWLVLLYEMITLFYILTICTLISWVLFSWVFLGWFMRAKRSLDVTAQRINRRYKHGEVEWKVNSQAGWTFFQVEIYTRHQITNKHEETAAQPAQVQDAEPQIIIINSESSQWRTPQISGKYSRDWPEEPQKLRRSLSSLMTTT